MEVSVDLDDGTLIPALAIAGPDNGALGDRFLSVCGDRFEGNFRFFEGLEEEAFRDRIIPVALLQDGEGDLSILVVDSNSSVSQERLG